MFPFNVLWDIIRKIFSLIFPPSHNPYFQPSGLLLNHEHSGFQFLDLNDNIEPGNLSYPKVPEHAMILQSCNGLLICCCPNSKDLQYSICNPTTKQFTPIHFPNSEFEVSVVTVNLAFDPFKSPHYKLICVRMDDEQTSNNSHRIDIYSSETRSWRNPISRTDNLSLTFAASSDIDLTSAAVYCNGAIHWYSNGETSLYFNTDTECLKTMPMPLVEEGSECRYFGESRGHLYLIAIRERSALEFDILELKTDYSGWFVRYHVNLDDVKLTLPDLNWDPSGLSTAFSMLCVVRAEKEEESTLVLCVSGEAISFNIHKKTSKKLSHLVPGPRLLRMNYKWNEAYQYMKTLFHV